MTDPLGCGLVFLTECELNNLWHLPNVKPFCSQYGENLAMAVDISAKLR
jgi:hypothetical protein